MLCYSTSGTLIKQEVAVDKDLDLTVINSLEDSIPKEAEIKVGSGAVGGLKDCSDDEVR